MDKKKCIYYLNNSNKCLSPSNIEPKECLCDKAGIEHCDSFQTRLKRRDREKPLQDMINGFSFLPYNKFKNKYKIKHICFNTKDHLGYEKYLSKTNDKKINIFDKLKLYFNNKTLEEVMKFNVFLQTNDQVMTDLIFTSKSSSLINRCFSVATSQSSVFMGFGGGSSSGECISLTYNPFNEEKLTYAQSLFLDLAKEYLQMEQKYFRRNYFVCKECEEKKNKIEPYKEIQVCENCGTKHEKNEWLSTMFYRMHYITDIKVVVNMDYCWYISDYDWERYRIMRYRNYQIQLWERNQRNQEKLKENKRPARSN